MKSNTKNNYVLQRLLPSKWEEYKTIRLEALQTNPEMFGSNYLKEAAYSQNDWVSFLEDDTRAMFALYDEEYLSDKLKVYAYPTHFSVDRAGKVVKLHPK